MDRVKIELDQDAVNDLAGLAYAAWAQAFDAHKAAKTEINDGSQDWDLFHEERLRGARAAEEKAKRTLAAISVHSKFR